MSGNMDIITLLSDDEAEKEEALIPPQKRIKLITIDTNVKQASLKTLLKPSSCIVLSDEEDDNSKGRCDTNNIFKHKGINNEIKSETKIDCKKIADDGNNVINIEDDEIVIPLPPPVATPNGEHERVMQTENKEQMETNGSISEPSASADDTQLFINGIVENDALLLNKENIEIANLIDKNEIIDDEDDEDQEIDCCHEQFFAFVDDCLQLLTKPEQKKVFHDKLPSMRKLYRKVKQAKFDQNEFMQVIKTNSQKISSNRDSQQVVICFSQVYSWLKTAYQSSQKQETSPKTEEQKQSRIRIKKLEKTLKKVRRRLAHLEKAEIDWDDEEDSVYLQYSRYSERAISLYKKICQYYDDNPNQGRLTHMRLDFSNSEYTEINRAINKKYRNNTQFPTYYDLDKLIRKCVKKHNLEIPEHRLQYEIKHCFEKLGRLLQSRRKVDSYQFLQDFLEDTVDPAAENPEIDQQIQANQSTYSKKLDDIFEKYAKLQETGVEPSVSSDSDDSNLSESDDEGNKDTTRND